MYMKIRSQTFSVWNLRLYIIINIFKITSLLLNSFQNISRNNGVFFFSRCTSQTHGYKRREIILS